MRITLANLHEATEQQVFDQVAKHLLTQRLACMHIGRCYYRLDGMSCAAGCLIDDSEYKPSMEVIHWKRLADMGLVPKVHVDLIRELQIIHDTISPYLWRKKLQAFAEEHGLSFNLPEDCHL